MKRRLLLTGWLSLVLLVGVSASVLAATVSGPDNTIKTRTKGKAGGLEVGFLPQESWLTPKEGDLGSAALLVKVNKTTFVVPAAPLGGEEPGLDSDNAGLVFCSGSTANSCGFIKLGPLDGISKPLVVNDRTVVIQGVGANKEDCEAGKGEGSGGPSADKDDTLFAVFSLGSGLPFCKGPMLSNLCLFAHATDPIRVNDDCIVFTQPGGDNRFGAATGTQGNVGDRCGAALDDEIRLVCGFRLFPRTPIKMTTINVGTRLGVHLGGSAADRGVRLSGNMVVWASPGPDGHFASFENPACGATTDPNDDGLITLKLGNPTFGIPHKVSFLPIGRIPGNFNGRPERVNETAVVLRGTGPNQEEHGDAGEPLDDEVIVVEKLGTSAPTITTYSGFGLVPRLLRLNRGAVVGFERDFAASPDILRAHVIRGIVGNDWEETEAAACLHFGSQELKTVTVTSGGMYHAFDEEVDKTKKDNVGLVLNCNQAAFWTQSPSVPTDRQAFLLTNTTGTPLLTPSDETNGALWSEPKAARVNDDTIVYTVTVAAADVETKGLGFLKASSDGTTFNDTRLTLPTGAGAQPDGCPRWNEPSAAQPVRLSDKRAAVLAEGLDCQLGRSPIADDGLIFIDLLDTGSPTTSFVNAGRSCAAIGCKPVALGGSSPDLVVLAGPGANGDMNEDRTFSECSFGTPTCSSGTLACPGNGIPVCVGGGAPVPTCSSGSPTCSGTSRSHAYCDSGVSPSCSGTTLTCSSGAPLCPAGFTSNCASSASCTAKDDDTLTVVSFP